MKVAWTEADGTILVNQYQCAYTVPENHKTGEGK